MTAQDLYDALKKTGYPVTYSHFDTPQRPPFITYIMAYTENFFSDNRTAVVVSRWQVELYTGKKDVEAEETVENALSEFCWNKTETFIDDEKVFQIIYEISEV